MFAQIRRIVGFNLIRNEHDISMIRALSLGLNLTKHLISVKLSKLMRERDRERERERQRNIHPDRMETKQRHQGSLT